MQKFINYFIPPQYLADPELHRKSRFCIVVIYVLLAFVTPILLYTYYIRPDDIGNIVVGIIMPLLLLFCLWLFKRTGSFAAVTHIICGFATLTIYGSPFVSGGIYSPDMPAFYIVPVFALTISNLRTGLLYSVLILIGMLVYYIVEKTDLYSFRPLTDHLTPDYYMMNLVINGGVILFILFRNERLRLKLVAELRGVNRIVTEKNKEITDSINYAKRIQQAQLPLMEEIHAMIPQSFVLFKPKDIISGDFYFFLQKEKLSFLAAADCTGHGVPGALLSMISGEKLHDAVLAASSPGEILQHVNRGIRNSLKQSDSHDSTRDGMDIALCALDRETNALHYAGANRPLWILRKDKNEIEELKATKKAIGGLTDDAQTFDAHSVQLQPGDTFYIFSDGYADTFSGRSGKKLTTKKFKQLLTGIQHKNMEQQKQHLDEFIEDWKQDAGQVDDILVIGVRV